MADLIGFAFNNPDLTSDYHAPKWGLLVSHHELRYVSAFGNPLIAEADSFAITDEMLLDFAREAISYVEKELSEFPKTSELVINISAELEEIYHAQVKARPINLFMHHKKGRYPIHSFFCRKFLAVWYSDGKIIEKRIVKPWQTRVCPAKKFDRLLEVPL